MDMKTRVEQIYHLHIDRAKKIGLLKECILECYNEMEAQDENMHPEVQHNSGEGLRMATIYLRKLTQH